MFARALQHDALETPSAMYRDDVLTFMDENIGRRANPAEQIVGHRRSEAAANQQMNGSSAAAFGEEHRGLTRRVSAANDCHILRVVEDGLDGSARVVNSGGFEAVCAFGLQLSPAHARCDQHGASAKLGSAVEMQKVAIFRWLVPARSARQPPALPSSRRI